MSREVSQPQPIENRPGLAKIDYRIGEFATIRQRLLDLLPLVLRQPTGQSPLAKLTTRAENDPAIALLDAWAVVADVLTFYQERIANEGFLRTATERRSVLELVRAIGYELSPGVAASSYLTFTVEEAPGSPDIVLVPQGTQVMSVPVKDELPQTFETSAAFTAYREWNAIRPRPSRPQIITPITRQLYLTGSSTQLQAGDFLLLVDEQPTVSTYLLRLTEVISNPQTGYTLVRWFTAVPAILSPLRNPQVFAFRQRASLLGSNAPPFATMPAEVKLAAIEQSGGAIRGGVVRSRDNGDRWIPASQGLPDSDILCLAVRGTTLLAGTPNKGIFRSLDNGTTWKAVNEGLTSQNVLALHISAKDTIFNEAIFAGTPNGGVFRSKDQGNNWVPINTGSVRVEEQGENNWQSINTSLPNTVVRSILTYSNSSNLGTGTIYSEGNSVRGENTAFLSELREGDEITALEQTQTVASIESETALTLENPFTINSLPRGTVFLATIRIDFRILGISQSREISTDEGLISSEDNVVRGEGTSFRRLTQELEAVENLPSVSNISSSMRIRVGTQELTINRIESDTRLITNGSFSRNNLDPGTSFLLPDAIPRSFIFVGTDEGVFRSQDQGQNWIPRNLTDRAIYSLFHPSNSNILAGTDAGIFYSEDDGESWNSPRIEDRKVFSITGNSNFLFAGTDQGVFRASPPAGNPDWTAINGNNPSLAEREVRSLTIYSRGGQTYLIAATDNGIFVSNNATTVAVTWQLMSQDLAVQDMNAIAISDTTKTLFAGSVFKGFTEESDTEATGEVGAIAPPIPQPRPVQNLEWPDFRIQDPRQIDLETLHPQILPDSWMVLFDDRDPQNPAQEAPPRLAVRRVDQVFAIQRSAFGLSGKITRIEPNEPINPDEFGLRSTTVFARSEVLPLALEPLTVGDRGFDIFQDPIKPDTVFLRDFIQNLQPQQTLIIQGQHCRMQLDHVGGIYRTQFSWNNQNQGLENLSIRLLTQINEDLITGTDEGLYRLSGGISEPLNPNSVWERVYGLKAEPVYTLLPLTADLFLAGTEQGLYQTSDVNDPWQRVLALPEDIVFALTDLEVSKGSSISISAIISGTVLSSEEIPDELQVGDIVTLADENLGPQSRFVTEKNTSQFKINAAFDPEPETNDEDTATLAVGGTALFVGMRRGLYRSPDRGTTWEAIEDFNEITITALATWQTTVIVGTQAGISISRDTGQTWKLIEPLKKATVRSLLTHNNHLWVGTTRGLYQVSNLEAENPTGTGIKGLRDRIILSLILQGSDLIAGTDRGIYRSRDDGQTWITLDAGLAADEGRSLLLSNDTLLVGTEAGVFQSNNLGVRLDPTNWERRDTGLTNSQVTALALDSSGTVIMAGVTAGVFRSGDGGRTWEPLHDGLIPPRRSLPLRVQALLAQPQGQNSDRWFAGTPEGIFGFDAERQQWQALTTGLVYREVRAIALHQGQIYIGTIHGGVLRLESNPLEARTDLETARWQPTGLGSTNVQALVSAENLLLAGTERDGLFISRDGGTLWRQITETRPGQGTLSSDGNQVLWQGSFFGNQLQPGDRINAAGQTRTIINLTSQSPQQVEITVNELFRPDLPDNTEFSIHTGLTNRHITAIATAVPEDRANAPILFVATAGSGVFRSNDGGDRWQQVITNLTDLEIRCMAVEQIGSSQRVWVGTAHQGVFRSDDGGELWAAVNTNLTNTDVQAILIPPGQENERPALLVGGIGILPSPDGFYTRPVQRGDIVQVLQPPVQPTLPDAANPGAALWHIQVRDKDGFPGVLQTPALADLTLLPAAEDDALVSEVVVIQDPPTDQQLPILTLQQPLQYSYDPASFQIFANVVRATHGETVAEILGSGDGNEANPRFELSKPPLTYVPADNARGAASTLKLRVNGVLWQETSSLYPLKPQDQSYIIRIENDGTPAVTFGDGVRGARLPSGQENVSATYRSGIGLDGNVAAQTLSILKTRPQGISDVTNPLAATGGAGAETMAEAQTKAPPTVRTLDRIVSLQDFEDFAQGFAGIGKAEAIALWNGSNPLVHVTIAGIQGAEVPETSSLYEKLVAAIDRARDPIQQVEVASYERILFNLEGRLLLDPRYQVEVVMAQIQTALAATFAFERRGFGQAVTSAEAIEAIQGVAGVTAIDLDALYRFGRSKTLESVLTAETARYDPQTRTLLPAQLFLLNAAGLQLTPVPTL